MHFFYGLGFRIVAAVAERFILRFSTAAKSDPVAHSICFAVGRFNWNPAVHPNGAAYAHRWVFNQPDGLGEFRLNYLSSLFVKNHETT